LLASFATPAPCSSRIAAGVRSGRFGSGAGQQGVAADGLVGRVAPSSARS
jgi:hypothetical protein